MKCASHPTLSQARRLALAACRPWATAEADLAAALGKVAAAPLRAAVPVPPFAQVTRDGYALRARDRGRELLVVGEMAAGCRQPVACGSGQAVRVMTGAPLPPGCDLVIPLEEVTETAGRLLPAADAGDRYIRRRGCDLAAGRVVVPAGTRLLPEHLARAAAAGVARARIYLPPPVAVLCTGSELVTTGAELGPGQIFSANLLLLEGLIRENGGAPCDLAPAADRLEVINGSLAASLAAGAALIITTGGTGPGRYDLLARAFADLGVETLFAGLAVRPGHLTRLGRLGDTLLLALPGPPPAVRLLFNELARPLLYRLTGRRPPGPVRARLTAPLLCKGRPCANLKGGVYSLRRGLVLAREAGRGEAANCVLVLPARARRLPAGTPVTIHPCD